MQVGDKVHFGIGSDCYPGTVVKITASGKTIWVREDVAIRTDNNGMSEDQTYRFEDGKGEGRKATMRKSGMYQLVGYNGVSGRIYDGHVAYYDYSF